MPLPPVDEDGVTQALSDVQLASDAGGAAGAGDAPLPVLDSGALMAFLASTLSDLESAQGSEDSEARAWLAQLEAQLAGATQTRTTAGGGPRGSSGAAAASLGQQQQRGAALTDLQIASHIDRCDQQACSHCMAPCE